MALSFELRPCAKKPRLWKIDGGWICYGLRRSSWPGRYKPFLGYGKTPEDAFREWVDGPYIH